MERGKLFFKRNHLTKRNDKGSIIWEVDMDDPEWYLKVATYENAEKLSFNLEVTSYKVFKWGNYIFNFPCGKDNTLYETAMVIRGTKVFPEIPMLRTGMILKDEDEQLWEIIYMEPFSFPPSRLKGANRFEPPEGIYAPYGWFCFRYKIEPVKK